MCAIAACANTTGEFDELAGETEDEVGGGKADAAIDGSYTYFEVWADLRKCASPMCGGFFFSRLNRSTTTCHDGKSKSACYAPVLDWSETDLDEGLQAKLVERANLGSMSAGVFGIVRGRFARTNDTVRPDLGRFVVSEAWVAEGEGVTDGVFARIKDAGVRCITTPCNSILEKGLNTSRTANIAGLDFDPSGLSERQVEGFWSELWNPSGIIVAGNRYTFRENNQSAKGRTVTNAFHRLVPLPTSDCFVGGCSGQVCSEEAGVITTCEWRDEYACYQSATCERQADGACGWTQTPELSACIVP